MSRNALLDTLRCPACHGTFAVVEQSEVNGDNGLACLICKERYPIIRGIPRLLRRQLRDALLAGHPTSDPQMRTARSFGYEWSRFPEMYREWEQTFLDYMQPHTADFFRAKKVLDAGCGNGRFAYYAAKYGADVWAIDLGGAVEVANQNATPGGQVHVIQADLHEPPFAPASFDFIYSTGVLHHLAEPQKAFVNLLKYLKPGGEIQIYLYWKPEGQPIKSALLSLMRGVRQITTRLPLPLTHALAFPAALAAFGFLVWPYQVLKKIPGLGRAAENIPMKQYAQFPFRVCVNDQLDRFSAPIENRYTKQEVLNWLNEAGLEDIAVYPNYGWVGIGRKPFS